MTSKMITKTIIAGLFLAQTATMTACMSFSDRSFRPVKNEISKQYPELKLEKDFAVSVGATMFNTIDLFAFGSEFDFSSIDKVQVAVYSVSHVTDLSNLNIEQSLMARDRKLNWQTVAKVREAGQFTWVLVGVNEGRQSIDGVTILVLERNELVMINVRGDLKEMIEFAMKPVKGERGAVRIS